MAGIGDNFPFGGDWVPHSPSPRAFFSAILGEDISAKTTSELPTENKSEGLVLGLHEQMAAQNVRGKEAVQADGVQLTGWDSHSEQRASSRGGLAERMAARAGFNAPRLNTENIRSAELSLNPEIHSPYLTIPPGLSPTTLLESPVFLSNSLAQPSPTTGKFSFLQNGIEKSSSTIVSEAPDKTKQNSIDDINTFSFAFKPVPESSSSFFLGASSKTTSAAPPRQSFPSIEVAVEKSVQSHGAEPPRMHSESSNGLHFSSDMSKPVSGIVNGGNSVTTDLEVNGAVGGSDKYSPPPDEQQDEGDQRTSGDCMAPGGGAPAEDGYNWRKYGQKQVKGSEYPRSYYKCTHPNCPVKKKVERSHEGHITEIIYKGAHNHSRPPPNRRSGMGSSFVDMQPDSAEQLSLNDTDNDPLWGNTPKDWKQDNFEVTSSTPVESEFANPSSEMQAQNGVNFESADAVDASSTFSNEQDDDDRATHGSVGYDGGEDELESKRRKIETYAADLGGASRAIREPRVVVQTTSEVDILDDGYRWRKYGQKVVKGNPNPRSYYKCTHAGCTVRKHVERASHDLKSVITTYEGKHNHDVPAARNSSHVNSGTSGTMPVQTASSVQSYVHRPDASQMHSGMARFDRSAAFGSFVLPGRQQMGPSPNFTFGMNQPGLANLTMAGLGPGQAKMPVMPVHLAQQQPINNMGFMLPKGEPKVEPVTEPNLNLANNSSVYQQIMTRLPLGP